MPMTGFMLMQVAMLSSVLTPQPERSSGAQKLICLFLVGQQVAGQFLAITDFDGRLIVLNAANGDLLWSRIGNPESTRVLGASSPAIAKNELIFTGNDAEVSALDISQSGFLWGDNLASLIAAHGS
jgi:outer membrane protein assembly factor BamB